MTTKRLIFPKLASSIAIAMGSGSASGGQPPEYSMFAVPPSPEWIQVESGENFVVFYRTPILRGVAPETVRIWLQWEYSVPHQSYSRPYLSAVELSERDCQQMRMRPIQSTLFPQKNMKGVATTYPGSAEWTYNVPGSVGEAISKFACANAPR